MHGDCVSKVQRQVPANNPILAGCCPSDQAPNDGVGTDNPMAVGRARLKSFSEFEVNGN